MLVGGPFTRSKHNPGTWSRVTSVKASFTALIFTHYLWFALLRRVGALEQWSIKQTSSEMHRLLHRFFWRINSWAKITLTIYKQTGPWKRLRIKVACPSVPICTGTGAQFHACAHGRHSFHACAYGRHEKTKRSHDRWEIKTMPTTTILLHRKTKPQNCLMGSLLIYLHT